MKNEDFLLKIKEIIAFDATSIDFEIAKNIIEKTEEVAKLTLSEFSKNCFASKPTVIKFCHKIGLSGFSELKYYIKNSLKLNKTMNQEISIAKDFQNTNKFNQKYVELGKEYYSLLIENFNENHEIIQNLINRIKESTIVYIFCANLAYFATKNFFQKLHWINKNVVLENDFNIIESHIAQINSDHLVIIISLSGSNPHILQITKWLKNQNDIFILTGKDDKILNQSKNIFLIPQIEKNLWDNYSLRAQFVTSFFDLIFIELL